VIFPAGLGRYLDGWTVELAWEWRPGRQTWRLTSPAGQVRYLKARPADAEIPLAAEAARLRWALAASLPVPPVVAEIQAGDADWLITEALPGVDATRSPLRASDPGRLVRILAAGLRRFHEQAPAAACPFRSGPEQVLEQAARRVRGGLVRPADLHPEHAHLSPEAALAELARLRPVRSDLVVCHGDYCLPNAMISGGVVSGYVDLGELAVADRWSDLAVATWSVTWNLGPGWEDEFLAAYGLGRDDQAMAFYRLSYDVAS
jgi:kanamycin kinase